MSEHNETVLIEATTIEEALSALSEQFGSAATIVSAERVRKGGLAGFFATEMVELVAVVPSDEPELTGAHIRRSEPAPEVEETPQTPAAELHPDDEPTAAGVDSAFARLLAAANGDDAPTLRSDAATMVLDDRPASVSTRETEPVANAPEPPVSAETTVEMEPPSPAPKQPAASRQALRGLGRGWDVAHLIEIGIPGALLDVVTSIDPDDDLAHITSFAHAIAPLFGDVPSGPHHLVGAGAHRLETLLGGSDESGPRHLVLDAGMRFAKIDENPEIVSWTDPQAAPRAIAIALTTGAKLGWGLSADAGRHLAPSRLNAVDVALTIRSLVVGP